MKHYTLCILTTVLALFSIQPAAAQEVQDALYIFRNDGGFNAFFYADIDRIEYSKIDTLGVEQSDYVVQEVYALDSCFRIPVSAIDSVAFVTPETKYKADVKLIDKSISNYIVASDSSSWFRLSSSTPSSLIPKKGDKMVIEARSTYLPRGIGGIVDAIENTSDGCTVKMAQADLGDIYDRMVAKIAAASPVSGTRSRAFPEGGFEEITLPTVSKKYQFEGSFELLNIQEVASVSYDGEGCFTYEITPTIKDLRAFCYFDGILPKATLYKRTNVDGNMQFYYQGGITARLEIPAWQYKRDLANGKFVAGYGSFIEISKSGKFNYERWFNYDVEDAIIWNLIGYPLSLAAPLYGCSVTKMKNDVKCSNIENSVSANIGLYIKAEAKVGQIEGLDVSIGAGIDLGMGVESTDPVRKKDIAEVDLLDTDLYYELLNKDDLMNVNYYVKAQQYGKIGKFTPTPRVWNPSFETFKFGYVPNASNIGWKADNKCPWRGNLQSHFLKRDFLNPVPWGFLIIEKENEKEVTRWWDKENTWGIDYIFEHTFDMLDPGKDYVGLVLTKHHGVPIIANVREEFTLGPPTIDIKEHKVPLPEVFDGFREIAVLTNIRDVRFETKADWYKVNYDPELAKAVIDYETLPENIDYRKEDITVTGYDQEGNVLVKDAIQVTQVRPILNVTPSNLEFDKKGGTQKVTIETTYDNVEVVKGSEYTYPLPYEMSLNTSKTELTITVPENTTGDSRRAAIIVNATNLEGKKLSKTIYLYQSAEENSPYYITFDKTNVEVGKDANTYEFTSECNFNWYKADYKYGFEINGDDKHRWLNFKNGEYEMVNGKSIDKWYLTVEKNDWGFDRKATIDILVYDKDSIMTAKNQITIVQVGGEEGDLSNLKLVTADFNWYNTPRNEGINCTHTTYNSKGEITKTTDTWMSGYSWRYNGESDDDYPNTVKITKQGKGIHVELHRVEISGEKDRSIHDLVFDIDDISDNMVNGHVKNLIMKWNNIRNDVLRSERDYQIVELPFVKEENPLRPDQLKRQVFSSTIADGLTVTKQADHRYRSDGTIEDSFEMKLEPGVEAELKLIFNTPTGTRSFNIGLPKQ